MKWIRRFFNWTKARLYQWLVPPYRTLIVEASLPVHLKSQTLYIVQEDGFKEQAAMVCPCGCGCVLLMNLLPDESPCWHLTPHKDGTASLHPSVWRKKNCRAHFWFRGGRIYWCKEYD